MGYQIDPALRALAAYRTQAAKDASEKYKATLAFFDSESSEFSRSMYGHCREEAKRRGYELKYFGQPQSHEEQATFSKRLWAQGIRGIVFGPAQREFNLQGFEFNRFAMVGIGAFQHTPPVDSVSSDYFQGLYMAAQHCVERGYKNIGFFLVSYLEARTGHRWLGAYCAFCQHYGKKPLIWFYREYPSKAEISKWLKDNKIDAVLTLAEMMPRSYLKSGLRLVFLNDWHVESDAWCVSTPQPLIARESIHLLDDYLIHRQYGVPQSPRQISIKPVFHGD